MQKKIIFLLISFEILFIFSLIVKSNFFSNESYRHLNLNLSIRLIEDRKLDHVKIINFPKNNYYVTNNNIATYSSYIIIEEDGATRNETQYKVEAIIEQNGKFVNTVIAKENIKCVLKYFWKQDSTETIELNAFDVIKLDEYYVRYYRKYFFYFKLEDFKSYRENSSGFNRNNILVAVIYNNDFNTSLDEAIFLREINITAVKLPIVLPYSLISFQKPEILQTKAIPMPNVAVCGAQFYGNPSKELFNWIDYQQSFGIAEIMIYDGTIDRNVTRFINENFKDNNGIKLTTVPDQSLFYEQCNESVFYEQFEGRSNNTNLKDLLYKLCKTLFDWSHRSVPKKSKSVGWTANEHRIVVLNDCFTKLSKTYEYVAIYDFDEFIYPRTLDNIKHFYDNKSFYSCKNKSEICSMNPFVFTNPQKDNQKIEANFLYNYLIKRLEIDSQKRDMTKFSGFQFKQVETFTRQNEETFVSSLELLMSSINASTKFPLELAANVYHIFSIYKNDVDYVHYLLDSYKELKPCVYGDYLKNVEMTSKYDVNQIRIFYYLTSGERNPKSIHHFKNTKSLDIHYVSEKVQNGWIIIPSDINGHFSTHYRAEVEHFKRNFSGSIRQLNIDFEYLFYILKKYAKFC